MLKAETPSEGLRFISPTGVLGVGFPAESFDAALRFAPDFIACDAGSADWGPYYLGAAEPWAGYHQTRRDLEILLVGARSQGIPLLIGTAGMSGANPAVDWTMKIIEDIARDRDLTFTAAKIYSEQEPDWIQSRLDSGKITALDGADALTPETIQAAHRVVAMMGPEPFHKAINMGAEVIIAGRSSDAAVFAAFPIMKGLPPEVAWHMGKIVECGSAIAPGTGECIVGEVHSDSFTVRTARESNGCTASTVATHMLYENPTPHLLREPPGVLETSYAKYVEGGDGTVNVSGATFEPRPYSVRLEGVRHDGFRSIALVGVRDPVIVNQIDLYTDGIEAMVRKAVPERFGLAGHEYSISFRRYGYDAVLGPIEPNLTKKESSCYEIGLVTECTAPSQELATEILNSALPYIMHRVQVPGSSKGANAAFPYAPTVLETGPVFRWTLWHAAQIEDPCEPFPIELVNVGAK